MASGSPDWWKKSQIDVVAQGLNRMVVRTSLGTPVEANLRRTLVGIDTHPIVDITGKGIILGGYLLHITGASHKSCGMIIEIDGVSLGGITFEGLRGINAVDNFIYGFRLVHYTDVAPFYYVLGFNPGWTFDASLKLTLLENVGAGEFYGHLFYTVA